MASRKTFSGAEAGEPHDTEAVGTHGTVAVVETNTPVGQRVD